VVLGYKTDVLRELRRVLTRFNAFPTVWLIFTQTIILYSNNNKMELLRMGLQGFPFKAFS
jgi:hypothetical protein